jgi:protein disulfide-isomerase
MQGLDIQQDGPYMNTLIRAAGSRIVTLSLILTVFLVSCSKNPLPYDEHTDAHSGLRAALIQARIRGKLVLVVFGANWCPDCRELAKQMAGGQLAERIGQRFVVTKVDVGNWSKNLDIAQEYGNPIKKGIPAVAVVAPDGKLLQTIQAGKLMSARGTLDDKFLAVFDKLPVLSGR